MEWLAISEEYNHLWGKKNATDHQKWDRFQGFEEEIL